MAQLKLRRYWSEAGILAAGALLVGIRVRSATAQLKLRRYWAYPAIARAALSE